MYINTYVVLMFLPKPVTIYGHMELNRKIFVKISVQNAKGVDIKWRVRQVHLLNRQITLQSSRTADLISLPSQRSRPATEGKDPTDSSIQLSRQSFPNA
jgi:hypothetical protein